MFRQEVFCEASAVLNGTDEIVVEGVIGAEQRPVLAVVGGTGRFRNARAQVFILPGATEEETWLVWGHPAPSLPRQPPVGPALGCLGTAGAWSTRQQRSPTDWLE